MRRSVIIVASAIFLVTHAPSLQVPLYSIYAQKAGFGSGISAVAFATYVIGLLPTLILFGGISDRVGRKKVILASLLSAMLATFVMIIYPNIYALFITRVLQGIAVGLITGTGTAYISTIIPNNSAQVAAYVSLTSSLGFSSGALFTNAVLLLDKKTLVPLSYWVVFILTFLSIGFASQLPEQPISRTALVRLPSFPNGTIAPGFAIALAWSLAGIVSLTLPAKLIKYGLPDWSGLMLFIFVISGVLVQPFARRLKARYAVQFGAVILVFGYIVFTYGANAGALSLVIFGVAIAGTACYGFTYLGGLSEILKFSASQSARITSGYFICAYLGYGVPIVVIGFLSDKIGIVNSLFGFGVLFIISNILLALHYQQLKKKSNSI
ncbi:hypothetical protein NIES2101_02270 [Calothrix sp. HK-06]|nr:hypothetical protein NIES2101_02270 [Calothrix sp. HK-06]